MGWFGLGAFVVVTLMMVLLTRVQYRTITPLAFHCRRCDRDFEQAAHLPFPRVCPRCAATDWAA